MGQTYTIRPDPRDEYGCMKLPYRFGKYILLEKIADGGMAEIYRAKYLGERGFAKDLAVKRILPHWSDRKEFENMLIDEAKALVHLQHQNIVQVFELNIDKGSYFISMEYVAGVDLRCLYKRLEREGMKLPERYACFIASEVLKALDFAHKQKAADGVNLGIVHRDVSPQNILVSYNGEVKLTDFGIAKGLHRDQETTTEQLKGKYAYMSPEQARGEKLDGRSDLYSLAVVLYELVTGNRLYASMSDYEIIKCVGEARLPVGWETRLSLGMRKVLVKALSKDVGERYQTGAEFLNGINEYVSARKLHTHALELADYIAMLFEDRRWDGDVWKIKELKPTKVMKIATERRSNSVFKRVAALIFLSFTLLAGSTLTAGRGGDALYIRYLDEMKSYSDAGEAVKSLQPIDSFIPPMPPIGDGMISIESVPSGAAGMIKRDGEIKRFTTPFHEAGIGLSAPFEAELSLEKGGYESIKERVVIDASQPVFSRKYIMKSNAPPRLSVHARPWGYVYIPGVVERRESPVGGVNVKPGRHEIKVFYSPTGVWAKASLNAEPGKSHTCVADFTRGATMQCE